MEGQFNPVDNINTSINELERYTFENKQNRYNNLKVITDYLKSELDNLSHELNEEERSNKTAKIEETVSNLTTCFKTYEFPTASIDENTGEIIVNDDIRTINTSSQVLETSPEPSIPTPSESIDVTENSQFVNYPDIDSQVFEVETPTIETEVPMIETETPMVETETPMVETEAPMVETEAPMIEAEVPMVEAEVPMVETEVPMVEAEVPIVETEVPQINIFDDDNSENQEVTDHMTFGAQVPVEEMIDVNNNPQSFEYQPVENIEQSQDFPQEEVEKNDDMALDEQALDAFLNGNSGITL